MILAERRASPSGAEWVMTRPTDALVDGPCALEEAAPSGTRASVANVLQMRRVDFESRWRATLGLASSTSLDDETQDDERPRRSAGF